MRGRIFKKSRYPEHGYFIIEIPIKLIDYHNVLNKLTLEEREYFRKLYNSKSFDELDKKLLKICNTNPGISNYYICFRYEKIRKRETSNQIAKRMNVTLLVKSTTKFNHPIMKDYRQILKSSDQFYNKDREILDLIKYNKRINRGSTNYYSYDNYIAYCTLVLSRELLWKIKTT